MGRGNFPLSKSYNAVTHRKLKQAIDNIDEVLMNVSYDKNQFDNAAYDGACREKLRIAQNLINSCIE